MKHDKIILMILGMAAVTYIPRAAPAALIGRLRFGKRTEKFLNLLPYTAMSALIFPGVFSVDAGHPMIGVIGAAAAVLLAWKKCPLIVCVTAAILTDCLLYLLTGT